MSRWVFQLAGCVFVDDIDLIQTGDAEEKYDTVSRKLQEAVYMWKIGARASGGELVTEPTKSWYCLINFE